MCLMARLPQSPNYVTGGVTDPYRLCRFVNDGDCEMYEEGPNEFNPRTVEEYLNENSQPKGE